MACNVLARFQGVVTSAGTLLSLTVALTAPGACSADKPSTETPPGPAAGAGGRAGGPSGTAGGGGGSPGGMAGAGSAGTGGAGGSAGTGGGSAGAGGSAGMAGSAGAPADAGRRDGGGAPGDGPGNAAASPPGFPGWKYARPITIDTTATGGAVMGAVTGYPLAVLLNAGNFSFEQARERGEDLRFGKADGTPLPHAIESWDRAGQTAAVWVKVDRVAGNDATQSIMMYWGNPAEGDASDGQKVFASAEGFRGVWHLGDDGAATADGFRDASGTGAHATGVNLEPGASVPARIGKGVKLANAREQWLKVESDKTPLFVFSRSMTVSVWGKGDSFPGRSGPGGYDTIFSKGEEWTIQRLSNGRFEACFNRGSSGCAIGRANVATGQWYHFVLVVDASGARLYTNGVLDGSSGASTPAFNKPLGIGNQTQYLGNANEKRSWDGTLDEARFLSVAKDASWIKLDYESQREASRLLRFGDVQTR
jgi:biopolymer transport protein ExbB